MTHDINHPQSPELNSHFAYAIAPPNRDSLLMAYADRDDGMANDLNFNQ